MLSCMDSSWDWINHNSLFRPSDCFCITLFCAQIPKLETTESISYSSFHVPSTKVLQPVSKCVLFLTYPHHPNAIYLSVIEIPSSKASEDVQGSCSIFFALASLHLKTCPIIIGLYHLPFYRELSAGSCLPVVLQHLIQCLHSLYSGFLRWVKTKIDLIFLYETVLYVSRAENLPSSLRWLWTSALPPKGFSCRYGLTQFV